MNSELKVIPQIVIEQDISGIYLSAKVSPGKTWARLSMSASGGSEISTMLQYEQAAALMRFFECVHDKIKKYLEVEEPK